MEKNKKSRRTGVEERKEMWIKRDTERELERETEKREKGRKRERESGIHTLKSEASLTGFAVSPRIARTLQRCENFYVRACVSNEHFHHPLPPSRRHTPPVYIYIFFPPRPRANSAFNCAHRPDDIFLLLLCPRSRRTFRFNKILRPRSLPCCSLDYCATTKRIEGRC